MPVHPILNEMLVQGLPPTPKEARKWCSLLESGAILYFPKTPIPIPSEDEAFLLGQQQTGSSLHKNIAYKPGRDKLSGIDAKSTSHQEATRLHQIMRRYSVAIADYLSRFLAPYNQRWQLDYASYRPFEEEGRDLPMHRRNDLLHTDAFPTRPTRGRRILRFFHNIHPTRTRDWMVTEPFSNLLDQFAPERISLPAPDNTFNRAGRKIAQVAGLSKLLPQLKRTPYDEFMIQLHNTMKEDAEFQRSCPKEHFSFAPGSSWMVYTETVPHAVLAGQFALEQTFLVDPHAATNPDTAPLAILEKRVGARLA